MNILLWVYGTPPVQTSLFYQGFFFFLNCAVVVLLLLLFFFQISISTVFSSVMQYSILVLCKIKKGFPVICWNG